MFRYKLINVFIFTFDRANLLPIKVNKPEQKITAKTIETIAAKITKAHTHTQKNPSPSDASRKRERVIDSIHTQNSKTKNKH